MDFLKRTLGHAIVSVKCFLLDRRGVSTVEYALIVVAIIAIVGVVAGQLSGAFGTLMTGLEEEMAGATGEIEAAVGGGDGTGTGGTGTGGTGTGGTGTGGTGTGGATT